MNAIAILTNDHATVENLFGRVESTDESEHLELFKEIKAELEAHAHIEEAVFYPSLQADGDDQLIEITAEAIQEHQQMKTFLGELTVSAADGRKFGPLLIKLIEDVRHHVQEEENEMFPLVEAQFSDETIENWGSQMKAEKNRFLSSSETAHA